jgi:hypothetical protein
MGQLQVHIFDISFLLSALLMYLLAVKVSSVVYQMCKKRSFYYQIKKNQNLEINGGTIIKIDKALRVIYFMEEDTKNKNGERYLLTYRGSKKDIERSKAGDRIGILYGFNNMCGVINKSYSGNFKYYT